MSTENQKLVADLCRTLEAKGEALIPGTGVAIKDGDLVFIPPADLHLDRLQTEDIFTFNVEFDQAGNPELNGEATNPCHNISAYTNMYLKIFQEFDCGCVIYGQPNNGFLITELFDETFKIKNNQLITLITNGDTKEQYPSSHQLTVPIIENPDDQTTLFMELEKSFEKFPETNAVLIKGNGLVVCGENWQEAKLMFQTFIKLFQVAIDLKKIGSQTVSRPANVKKQDETETEISIVHQSKPPVVKKVARKPNVFKVRPAGLPTDLRTKISEEHRPTGEREALRRKKIALLRLRDRQAGQAGPRRIVSSSTRRNAASFMDQSNPSPSHYDSSRNTMAMGMGPMQGGNPGMNMNMNSPQMQFNNSNMDMMMGFHGMNQMNMPGMNMGNMGMYNTGNMMMMNQNPGMFHGNPGEQQGGSTSREERPVRGKFRGIARGVRGVRRPVKGNVKERLGFKSTISVDPSLLNEDDINEEEY